MRLASIFILSFALNFIWEHLHAVLYASYKGGAITNAILLHATLVDALIITLLAVAYLYIPFLHRRLYLIVGALLAFAIATEWWALATGRWVYGPHMPIIPLLHVGLTPTIQLAVLGYVSIKITSWL